MVNFVALVRDHWVNILVPMGIVIGYYMDKAQDQKLTAFRNKSALYNRYESCEPAVLMVSIKLNLLLSFK